MRTSPNKAFERTRDTPAAVSRVVFVARAAQQRR